MQENNLTKKRTTVWLCVTALFMAMNVVMSMSIFSIPVPGGHLYLNDIVICVASILLDPFGAFMVGGVGAFLGDFFFYPTPMFVSLVTHGLQAIVISVFSHYTLKKHPAVASGIGVTVGAIINIVGYSLGRAFFYASSGAEPSIATALTKLPFQVLQAGVGAVLGMIICWKFGIRKIFNKLMEK